MRILIAGGSGFLGSAISRALTSSGHQVLILTRRQPRHVNEIQWDGRTAGGWVSRLAGVDAMVNTTGFGLEHWPWTGGQKKRFLESRVLPGEALVAAVRSVDRPPATLVQVSGINYYGARGEGIADESWPAATDYLAQLAVEWEASTAAVEELGVRRVVARMAVVLDTHGGLFPLMALPVRLFAGGPLGDGRQAVPWIHLEDATAAFRFLLERSDASGVFNLIAPQPTSNAEFMHAVARAMGRPYWFTTPAFLLRIVLGEMSTLVVDGRYSRPKRLLELGFKFRHPDIVDAAQDLLRGHIA